LKSIFAAAALAVGLMPFVARAQTKICSPGFVSCQSGPHDVKTGIDFPQQFLCLGDGTAIGATDCSMLGPGFVCNFDTPTALAEEPKGLQFDPISFEEAGACGPPLCIPRTCSNVDGVATIQCGTFPDGCGGTLNCGTCAAGQVCQNGLCGASAKPVSAPAAPVWAVGGLALITLAFGIAMVPGRKRT
jgi:hypothetical protein